MHCSLARILAFAALSVGLSSSLIAQPQSVAANATEQAIAAPTMSLATPNIAEKTALDAANAEIKRRLSVPGTVLSSKSAVEAVTLTPTPSGKHDLVFRYRVGWIEWSEAQSLTTRNVEELSAKAAQAAAVVDLTPLQLRVLDREEADRIVKSCNAFLSATINPLTPPFYRRPTNVRWDGAARAPILRSFARIPNTENQCARADLNLVTAAMMCREVACATR